MQQWIRTTVFSRGTACATCILVLGALLLAHACARIAPPSGGPVDTTPPSVISMLPADGSVRVAPSATVRLRFSKPMNRMSVESVLFISPEPPRPVDLRWHGHELAVSIPGGLDSSTTYTVTVGAQARDLHGTSMGSSCSLAFSTGDQIDHGTIEGVVTFDDRPAPASLVWLYDLKGDRAPDPSSERPDYRTQAGSRGEFLFSSLSPSSYRLMAIGDRNRDGQYTQDADLIGVPSQGAILVPMPPGVVLNDLALAPADTVIRSAATSESFEDSLARAREAGEDGRIAGSMSGSILLVDHRTGQIEETGGGSEVVCHLAATAIGAGGDRLSSVFRSAGHYEWRLPPGRYVVSGFLDLNGNHLWDSGHAFPFRPSEPFRSLPDTILVRARWETGGTDIVFSR